MCMWIEGEENMACCIQAPSNNVQSFSTQECKLILFSKPRSKKQVILRLSFLYAFIRSLILTLPIVRYYHSVIIFNAWLQTWQQAETSVSQLHLPDLLNQKLWRWGPATFHSQWLKSPHTYIFNITAHKIKFYTGPSASIKLNYEII